MPFIVCKEGDDLKGNWFLPTGGQARALRTHGTLGARPDGDQKAQKDTKYVGSSMFERVLCSGSGYPRARRVIGFPCPGQATDWESPDFCITASGW